MSKRRNRKVTEDEVSFQEIMEENEAEMTEEEVTETENKKEGILMKTKSFFGKVWKLGVAAGAGAAAAIVTEKIVEKIKSKREDDLEYFEEETDDGINRIYSDLPDETSDSTDEI